MNPETPTSPPLPVSTEWRGYLEQLEALRKSLLKLRGDDVGRIETRRTHDFGTHPDRLAHCISLGILSRQQDPVFEVEAAITRLLDGSYGICEETGRPIPEARLRVVPWTRYTKEVLEPAERRRFGELLKLASIIPGREDSPQRKVFPVNAMMAQA